MVSIGSGLEKTIDENLEFPTFKELLYLPELYIPILAFISLIILTFFLKPLFYGKKN